MKRTKSGKKAVPNTNNATYNLELQIDYDKLAEAIVEAEYHAKAKRI